MTDYRQVQEALKAGASPEMLCMTCPWDRYCVTPPSMTSAEVKTQLDEAMAKDKRHADEKKARGEEPGMPVGGLLTALMLSGRDTAAQICPVLAMRLRTSEGRELVDGLKNRMQSPAS